MMSEQAQVEINGVELIEGTNLWRYANLNTWQQKIGDHDPDEILREVAEQLAEKYPDAVDNQPADVVQANLKANPGIYDDTDLMNYHAMEVKNINKFDDGFEISIKDWKEEKTYSFSTKRAEAEERRYTTFEPIGALEDHLGVTILPVTDDE